MQNSQTLQDYIFEILQYFPTKRHNSTKVRKLFPIVLKLFSNLKVCLIGEWSIAANVPLLPSNFSYAQAPYLAYKL